MDDKTLKALQGSIRKWDGIVKGYDKDRGTLNCPLCTLFYSPKIQRGVPIYCGGCPVAEAVRKTECRRTPYSAFALLASSGWAETDEAIEAAKAERAFLINLLPRGQVAEIYRMRETESDNSSPVSNAKSDALQDSVLSGGAR